MQRYIFPSFKHDFSIVVLISTRLLTHLRMTRKIQNCCIRPYFWRMRHCLLRKCILAHISQHFNLFSPVFFHRLHAIEWFFVLQPFHHRMICSCYSIKLSLSHMMIQTFCLLHTRARTRSCSQNTCHTLHKETIFSFNFSVSLFKNLFLFCFSFRQSESRRTASVR